MFKSLWTKFLLLLIVVSLIALSSAMLLRELMIRDFRAYIEGEKEDRVYWVITALESSYELYGGWHDDIIIENVLWALMLGLDVKLFDREGNLIMTTERAIGSLPPLVKKRVMDVSKYQELEIKNKFIPYVLFLRGEEIGHIEVSFLLPTRKMLYIERANRFLLISIIVLGGLAILISILFARRLTDPIKKLTAAASSIAEGNLKSRVVISGRDEIATLSKAFNKMAHALEMQEKLRKKLTSNIAHELRTPISSIRGELEGMIDGLIPVNNEQLQSLYNEAGRLKSIVEGIEDLSRAEASSITIRKRRFDLQPFLHNITGRYSKMFMDKGVAIELRCESGLIADADPDILSQIIVNLLSNALKATEKGGNVWIRAFKSSDSSPIEDFEDKVVIEVADNGCGIKDEDLPFIFERFYKAAEGGLGLGLTIVKELVEAHNGKIEVKSEYGKGSIFTIFLPLPPS
jgi:two-component system sensor histidine kinase BaeS